MKKKSKILITSLVLCLVASIGATFAFFFASTEAKVNVFTMSDGIKIALSEEHFDSKKAENFVPGRVIPKDPKVENKSSKDSVWVAIKLDYVVGTSEDDIADTYGELSKFADINFDTNLATGKWEAFDDNTIFYYKEPVPANITTSDLFSTVTIKNDGAKYNPFQIKVTAYAVQAEGLDFAKAKTELSGFVIK